MDMGPMGTYLMFGQGGKSYGGMMTKPKDSPMPTAWLYYVYVSDLDATIERAKSKGGKLLNGPMDIPGGDRVAQLMDPQGAAFALHGPGAAKAS
jgi:predicted enzyme related to lactoylglutathione lyase